MSTTYGERLLTAGQASVIERAAGENDDGKEWTAVEGVSGRRRFWRKIQALRGDVLYVQNVPARGKE